MTKRFLGVLAAVAALTALAPGQAQKVSSSGFERYSTPAPAAASYYDTGRLSPANKARVTMIEYGACLVEHDRSRVMAYLGSYPGSKGAAEYARGLAAAECLRYGDVAYDDDLLRGALYIALVREGGQGRAPRAVLTPVDYSAGAGSENPEAVARAVALRQFADCVVRADPAMSLTAVTSPVGSGVEATAYRTLAPAFPGCLTQGSNARLNRAVLSGLLAEALYRASAGSGTR